MSYILDALKKAAEQRDRQAPMLHRLLAPSPAPRSAWTRPPAATPNPPPGAPPRRAAGVSPGPGPAQLKVPPGPGARRTPAIEICRPNDCSGASRTEARGVGLLGSAREADDLRQRTQV